MQIQATLKDITIDFMTGDTVVSFVTKVKPQDLAISTAEIKGKIADLRAVEHKEGRSLNANSYFHVLVAKIAEKIQPPLSKPACKNMLIGRYGQIDLIDDQAVFIKTQIPPEKMQEQEDLHAICCGNKIENGLQLYFYRIYRGSHTYNTKEMSILIDGTVQEAKDLGIETYTPEQIERLKALWQSN